MHLCHSCSTFFFFNDTATTEIYTLSLHDALPISVHVNSSRLRHQAPRDRPCTRSSQGTALRHKTSCSTSRYGIHRTRSVEHTSELQSRPHLVCRLLLEKKKTAMCSSTINLYHLNS